MLKYSGLSCSACYDAVLDVAAGLEKEGGKFCLERAKELLATAEKSPELTVGSPLEPSGFDARDSQWPGCRVRSTLYVGVSHAHMMWAGRLGGEFVSRVGHCMPLRRHPPSPTVPL